MTDSRISGKRMTPKGGSTSTMGNPAGAADEEMFIRAFEDVPRVLIYTSKDLEQELVKIHAILEDASKDWEKRAEAMKRLRSLLVAGAADYDELYSFLKQLEFPFQLSVKDLRSKVVRETCITIAYMSQRLGVKVDRFIEGLLSPLINLIPNSAKIMSTSAVVCIRFIIRYTHATRLIPIITYNLSSKAKDIRRACYELLDQLLHTWPTHPLEKHVGILQEAIKKGISDADPEARAFSRKAFWGFADHFKDQADCLLHSLDPSKQKMLYGEQVSMTGSSSTNSLVQAYSQPIHAQSSLSFRPRGAVSSSNSIENLSRPSSSLSSFSRNRSGIPIFSPKNEPLSTRTLPSPLRTTSAIDVGAVRRARARAAIAAAMAQPKVASGGYSLPRASPKRVDSSSIASAITSPERVSRAKTRVSQSQPSSRSASPSSRLSYHTEGRGLRVRRKSGIPQSTSRETSPNRATSFAAMERRLSSSGRSRLHSESGDKGLNSASSLLAEKVLQQSQEAEAAFADALKFNSSGNVTARRSRYSFDDQSDESETSSVCSDRSFGGRNVEDVSEIIRNLSSAHWSDRKEGLLGLQFFLRHSSRGLNAYELKRITDIFTKMLLDPHTKTFTLFLDILNELILVYKQELNNWLYVLMTRLFLKMGTDTLGSVQAKILKSFELIRDSFTCEDQFNVIVRFLSDQTQTPNAKVKLTVLQYLHNLIQVMDPSEWTTNNHHELQLALMKIISWTADPKSQELRRYSQDVILDLFNLNTPEFFAVVNQLPKTYQDAAFQLVYMQRKTQNDSAFSIITSNTSILQTPSLLRTSNRKSPASAGKGDSFDDTENLNPEEIYNSLKQTSEDIQKYNFEMESVTIATSPSSLSTGAMQPMSPITSPKKTVTPLQRTFKDFSSTSQDSGISQIDGSSVNQKTTPSPPVNSANSSPHKQNHCSPSVNCVTTEASSPLTMNIFAPVLRNLRTGPKDSESQKEALNDLIELIREAPSSEWSKHFKDVFKVLLEKMSEEDNSMIRAFSLRVMCELLMKQTKYFQDYIELIILRILEASKDNEKEVQRASEVCAGTAAAVLPSDQCLRILKSVITTGDLPMNQAAVKMLTKLVEQQPKHEIMNLLPEMMPALVQAYDNPESAVRKSAVFCMVSIHNVVGDEMKAYLTSLNGSKLKLLKLYIERSKAQSSGCSSPISPAAHAAS